MQTVAPSRYSQLCAAASLTPEPPPSDCVGMAGELKNESRRGRVGSVRLSSKRDESPVRWRL